jgi:predicted phospho-2-dehydro-3-deoxyheptonate aldolase
MIDLGKKIRMERIMDRDTKRSLIVPLDHGVTMGPIRGIEDVKRVIIDVADGGATGVVMNKGMIAQGYRGYGRDIGLIMHLSASTILGPSPDDKVLIGSVEQAIKMGADAIGIHVTVGADTEPEMLRDLGFVSEECLDWGMPLFAMIYARGRKVKDPLDLDALKHVARLGGELGADMVTTNYTGSVETFKELVKCVSVPVLVTGGQKRRSDLDILKSVKGSIEAGGAGAAIGRNIFQHERPFNMTRALSKIIFEGASVEEAAKELTGKGGIKTRKTRKS